MKFTWLRNIHVKLLLPASLVSLAVPAAVLAQGPAQVYILPPSEVPVTGHPLTLDIMAEGVRNLYGAEIHLRFDPTAARIEDADPQQNGVQLTPGSLLDPAQGFVVANRSDNQVGTAVFAVTLVDPAQPVEGGGIIAQFTFVPLRAGMLQFELENVKLVTHDLQTLDVSQTGLEVQVGAQAVVPADVVEPTGGTVPPITSAPPATGVPIWLLVLVAVTAVSIPLAGAWFIFVRETNQQPRSNSTN